MISEWTAAGTYALILRLDHPKRLCVGRLGAHDFAPGYYAYVGSARGPGGLASRIGRHIRAAKGVHWHIDYLLPAAALVEVWARPGQARRECDWAQRLLATPGATAALHRFGSSDCRCQTHLIYWNRAPEWEGVRAALDVAWIARPTA